MRDRDGLSGEEARGGAQQIAGVHQDDAAVHAFHPLSLGSPESEIGTGCFGFPSSLPDAAGVNGRNSIFGVAYLPEAGRGVTNSRQPLLRTVMLRNAAFAADM